MSGNYETSNSIQFHACEMVCATFWTSGGLRFLYQNSTDFGLLKNTLSFAYLQRGYI